MSASRGHITIGTSVGLVLANMIGAGVRPTLPKDCPDAIRSLIERCWDQVRARAFGVTTAAQIN